MLQESSTTGISGTGNEKSVPGTFQLSQNFPNPFNPVTMINYKIQIPCKVVLKVYDVMGREIRTMVDGFQSAGQYSVSFNAVNLPSGIYIYKLNAGSNTLVKKMILLK